MLNTRGYVIGHLSYTVYNKTRQQAWNHVKLLLLSELGSAALDKAVFKSVTVETGGSFLIFGHENKVTEVKEISNK